MVLHLTHIVEGEYSKIVIRTVDTDVLVLVTAAYHHLQADCENALELWVSFGTGTHMHFIQAHKIAITIEKERTPILKCVFRM